VGSQSFYFGDKITVGVRDLERAIAWYQEKLGLRLKPIKSDDFDAFLALSESDEAGLALVRVAVGESEVDVEEYPILFTKQLEACREELVSRGIQAGPIQQDLGGNPFFQFLDGEGNTIEVCIGL